MPCQAVVQYVVVGHNKVFAPSQGGPSPPSSVTSLDNSPHFKPGSPPGQLCSSRKRLLRDIWSLLRNIFGVKYNVAWCLDFHNLGPRSDTGLNLGRRVQHP